MSQQLSAKLDTIRSLQKTRASLPAEIPPGKLSCWILAAKIAVNTAYSLSLVSLLNMSPYPTLAPPSLRCRLLFLLLFACPQLQLIEGCACHPHPACREVWIGALKGENPTQSRKKKYATFVRLAG